ncbi:MAG: hypothetical protein ACK4XK_06795 [Casimicrobiaceae bacterium]
MQSFPRGRWLIAVTLSVLAGCASAPPPRIDYPPPARTPPPVTAPPVTVLPAPPVAGVPAPPERPNIEVRAVGPGLDLQFERSLLLTETLYRNADALRDQVAASGAMGVNRGFEAGTGRGEWFIDEQRFAGTIIGAGVNRNRRDLIDAGLRALEWGFARQSVDGGFATREPLSSTAYFVAAAAHGLWLIDAAGLSPPFAERIAAIRGRLERTARWLVRAASDDAAFAQLEGYTSRRVVLGYALAIAGRVLGAGELAQAGEAQLRQALKAQHASGYLVERGGFDVSFQAEALVYLLRYLDHAATAAARRELEPHVRRGVTWLEGRINRDGFINNLGSTRTTGTAERDRTGQPRRVSVAAVVRAFGLTQHVLGEPRYERLARTVATTRQPG